MFTRQNKLRAPFLLSHLLLRAVVAGFPELGPHRLLCLFAPRSCRTWRKKIGGKGINRDVQVSGATSQGKLRKQEVVSRVIKFRGTRNYSTFSRNNIVLLMEIGLNHEGLKRRGIDPNRHNPNTQTKSLERTSYSMSTANAQKAEEKNT